MVPEPVTSRSNRCIVGNKITVSGVVFTLRDKFQKSKGVFHLLI